ncbi:Cwc15 protein [Candida orthopsilosis Co 90-125]|uniref:Pre-mRNA-splicing factor CWC15 n=1 Tax=Candida orthopsilosis (strain 90-125) TaxID=1136231 RepID=H8X534_CANO9|nr:Cwc15 protein [Candida orthopsilosis Co 90-125]CCG23127.1 Cwc15 protein [Candida orthopsilosis Co 90-125]
MTTNHRPTLESKKGKNITIRDSIVHARSFPQSQNLKLRSDIQAQTLDNAVKELKEETKRVEDSRDDGSINDAGNVFDEDEGEVDRQVVPTPKEKHLGHKLSSHTNKRIREDDKDQLSSTVGQDENITSESWMHKEGNYEEPILKKSRVDDKEADTSEVDDDDDDDDEDTAALIAEINKIKQGKTSQSSEQPLKTQYTNLDDLLSQQEPFKKKTGWRKSTKKFNEKKQDQNTNFTTDSLNSQFHQDFLSKYIR